MTKAKDRPDVQVFTEIAIIDQLVTARLERSLPEGMSAAQSMSSRTGSTAAASWCR